MDAPYSILPREKLDFDLAGDIPKYWFDGDKFKSRFFDAMSTLFPEGERYFIESVRAYRDEIDDPRLTKDVKHFIRQEAQHGMVHAQYNERLQAQGFDNAKLQRFLKFLLHKFAPKLTPRIQMLSDSAATEHLTAIMAECLFTNKDVMAHADPRVRAMFAWHSIEEVEHKAVAYDVLTKVAKASYARRTISLLTVTLVFNLYTLVVAHAMLKKDDLCWFKRLNIMVGGIWWLFKPGGLYWPVFGQYCRYFKPGFHPWQSGHLHSYQLWLDTLARTGDPIQAGEALYASSQG